MKELFNRNYEVLEGVKEGNPSSIAKALLLPIVAQVIILPIILLVHMIYWGFDLKTFKFISGNTFSFSLILTTSLEILVYFWVVKYQENRSISSIGLRLNKSAIFKYIKGFILGLLTMGVVSLLIVITGNGDISINKNIDNISILSFIIIIMGWMIQGASEEIIIRGHMLPTLTFRMNLPKAILISSVYFSFLHLLNDGVSVLAVINLILFGIFECIYFIYDESLFGPCAFHSAWNFAQGNLFGFLVSGHNTSSNSIMNIGLLENNLINGGDFGPEGGVVTTIILIIAIIILLCFLKRKCHKA